MKITIWSLTSHDIYSIKNPKSGKYCCTFTKDGQYFILLTRQKSRDNINIFTTNGWELAKSFPVDTTDAVGLSICGETENTDTHSDSSNTPSSASALYSLAVYDTPLRGQVLFYSVDGRLLHRIGSTNTQANTTLTGTNTLNTAAKDNTGNFWSSFAPKSVCVNPNTQLNIAAIGGYNDKVCAFIINYAY